KRLVADLPLARRPSKYEPRAICEQRGGRVRRRRRVADVAAERTAVLDSHTPGLARRLHQHREGASDSSVAAQVGVRRERSDRDASVHLVDPAQLVEPPNVYPAPFPKLARRERHHHVRTARKWLKPLRY